MRASPPPLPATPCEVPIRRAVVAPIVRIGFHLLPVVRGQGAGAALLLEREAQPGWRGALADLARVFAGMRHLGATVGGVALLMPPAITLATQSVLLLLVSNVPLYCRRPVSRGWTAKPCLLLARLKPAQQTPPPTPQSSSLLLSWPQLLEHPLMQHRLGVVATGLELATMPLLVLQPLVVADSRGAASLLAGKPGPAAATQLTCNPVPSFAALQPCLPPCRHGFSGSRLPNHSFVHPGGAGGAAAHPAVNLQLGRIGRAGAMGATAGGRQQHCLEPAPAPRQARRGNRQPSVACCPVWPRRVRLANDGRRLAAGQHLVAVQVAGGLALSPPVSHLVVAPSHAGLTRRSDTCSARPPDPADSRCPVLKALQPTPYNLTELHTWAQAC